MPEAAGILSQGTQRVVPPKTRRSAIANGKLLPGVDQRSTWVRRCRELIDDHVSDLGGEANCSAAERSIVRRACVMQVELERLERKFAAAGEASADDLHLYQRITNTLRRCFEAIGLQRRPRDVSPSLGQLLVEAQRQEPQS
jgi:hypothetical protein